jgi:hypothetical protein
VAGQFIGLSVYDTIYKLVELGDDHRANEFLAEFKVPPKRGHCIKVKYVRDPHRRFLKVYVPDMSLNFLKYPHL